MTMPNFEPVAFEYVDDFDGGRYYRQVEPPELGVSKVASLFTVDQLAAAYEAGKRDAAHQKLTLTIAEIKDLAECAGFTLALSSMPDADELETEITIIECPKAGVKDDDGKPTHFAHIAYFDEYPEEGSYPLGNELPAHVSK